MPHKPQATIAARGINPEKYTRHSEMVGANHIKKAYVFGDQRQAERIEIFGAMSALRLQTLGAKIRNGHQSESYRIAKILV